MKTLLCSLLMTLLLASFAAAQCSYSASFTLSGAGGTALTRRTVQDCFDAVPFSSTRRDNVVGALQQMTSLYSFTDIATCSSCSGVYNLGVNLPSVLSTVSSTSYSSDYEMQKVLLQNFCKLYDAHTYYYFTSAYSQFNVIRPFLFSSSTSGSQQVITVSGVSFHGQPYTYFSGIAGLSQDPSSFYGKTLVKVNGVDAITYLQNIADNSICTYKSPGVRFNAGLKGSFSATSIGPGAFETADTEVYEFSDSSTYTATLVVIAYSVTSYNSPSSFATLLDSVSRPRTAERNPGVPTHPVAMLSPTAPVPDEAVRRMQGLVSGASESISLLTPQESERITRERDERIAARGNTPAASSDDKRKAAKPSDSQQHHQSVIHYDPDYLKLLRSIRPIEAPSKSGEEEYAQRNGVNGRRGTGTYTQRGTSSDAESVRWGTYTLSGKTVVVVMLTTFSGSGDAVTYMTDYINTVKSAINYGQTNGITEVIVDVAGNGGGYVCLSSAVLNQLFQAYGVSDNVWQNLDYRVDPSYASLITDSQTGTFLRPCSSATTTTADFMSAVELRSLTRGSRTSQYSGLFYFDCRSILLSLPSYYFSKVVVVTDGTCGSACSQFLSKPMADGLVTTVSYGGIQGETMDTSSFCGGNVEDWTSFVNSASGLSPALRFTPGASESRFNFAETYNPGASLPREFTLLAASKHSDFWPDLGLTDSARTTMYDYVINSVLSTAITQPTSITCRTAVQGSLSPAAELSGVLSMLI
jgi:hypothetical protein